MAEPKSKKKLDKVLNGKDVLVTAFGAMIGWGWVVSTGDWLQKTGSLGTILCGIMIYCDIVGTVVPYAARIISHTSPW